MWYVLTPVLSQSDLILEGVLDEQRYLEIWLRKLEVRNWLSVYIYIVAAILSLTNCNVVFKLPNDSTKL